MENRFKIHKKGLNIYLPSSNSNLPIYTFSGKKRLINFLLIGNEKFSCELQFIWGKPLLFVQSVHNKTVKISDILKVLTLKINHLVTRLNPLDSP